MTDVKITNFARGINHFSFLVRYDAYVVNNPGHKFSILIRNGDHKHALDLLECSSLYGLVVSADPKNNRIFASTNTSRTIEIKCWEVRPPVDHLEEYEVN